MVTNGCKKLNSASEDVHLDMIWYTIDSIYDMIHMIVLEVEQRQWRRPPWPAGFLCPNIPGMGCICVA